jgi:hypothetical protein
MNNNMDHIIKNYRICYKPDESSFSYTVQKRWLFLWIDMGFGGDSISYFSRHEDANWQLYHWLKKRASKRKKPDYYQPDFSKIQDE